VVAFSPAGLWTRKELDYSQRLLRLQYALAQRIAPFSNRATATALRRRMTLGIVYARPERVDRLEAAYAIRVLAGSASFLPTLDWIDAGLEMPAGLDAIRCPFRVAWGSRDLLLPPRQAPRWARIVPRAELVPLPGLGHLPMADDPGLVAEVTLDFTTVARAGSAAPA
jgi:pimeloyl-ACP methyl ester carboxylesterase